MTNQLIPLVALAMTLASPASGQSSLFGTYFLDVGNPTPPVNFVSETDELRIQGPTPDPLMLTATAADPRHDSDIEVVVNYGTLGVRARALPNGAPVDVFVDAFGQFNDTFTTVSATPGPLTGAITMDFSGFFSGAGFGSASLRFSDGVNSQMVEIVAGDPLPGPITFTYPTSSNFPAQLNFVAEVTASFSGAAGSSMISDFSNTFEWIGMTMTDSVGNPVEFSLQSASGFAYPVPEPSGSAAWIAIAIAALFRRTSQTRPDPLSSGREDPGIG